MVFTGLKSSTSCVISQECSMALCLLAPFGEEQKDAQQPLHLGKPGKVTLAQNPPCAGLCVGQACGLVREKPSGAKPLSFPDGKAPGFSALRGPVWPVWATGGGTTRPRPFRGDLGPHRAQFGRKKRNRPPPRVWGEFGGVILKQDKGSGSLERPQPDHFARQSRS